MDLEKKLKIGLVCTYPPEPCGIGAYFSSIADELQKRVHLVRIGTGKSKADYRINFKSFSFKRELARIVEKEGLDLLHMHYIASFYGKCTLNLNFVQVLSLKIPKVITMHETQFECKGIRGKIICWIEKQVCEKSDMLILHTPIQRDLIKNKYRVKEARVIYYGFVPKTMLPREGKNLLFFGILSRGKGIEYLVRAMEFLEGYKLRIVGSITTPELEKYKLQIEDEISRSPKKDSIELETASWFTEEEKEAHFRWANIIVLPHIWAPYQSGIVGDAAIYGLPVVVTRTGAIWDLVEHFGTGEIVAPADARGLAEGVKKVSAEYMSYIIGIKKYREESDYRRSAEKYVEAYKAVLAGYGQTQN